MATDPACLLIDLTTPEGRATGLLHDSVVSCLVMATIYADTIDQTLGSLSSALLYRLDGWIKAALGVT